MHDSILSQESEDTPVYCTLAQNLVAAATLADSLAPHVDGPMAEDDHRLTFYLRTAVVQQNVATSSQDRLASRSVQCRPSGARSRPITVGSSLSSCSTNRRPDTREDLNRIRMEQR